MPDDFFAQLHDDQTPPRYKYFTGSSWEISSGGKTTSVYSPITQEVLGELQEVTKDEIDAVMNAAGDAQTAWEKTPLNERIRIVHLAADWILHFEEYLTTLLVKEVGKTTKEATSEIKRTAELIDYYASEVQSMHGETVDSDNFPGFEKGRLAMIERVALGTVVAIAPFNYPVNLSASKIAPALLMGNSVVFKPPSQGGISGIHLTRIFEKAGVPKGVLSCVTGGGEAIGDYLVGHPKASMIAFTGSSDVGNHIGRVAGMTPMLFECGGNNPTVVFPDADMQETAREIIKGAFSFAGQRCTAIKYVLASQSVLDTLIPIVQEHMKTLVKMGDPRSPDTKMVGPVISDHSATDIEEHIRNAVAKGAIVIQGGKRDKTYVEPTLLTHVSADMSIVQEEVFGPVISFIAVSSMDEAVKIINASRFGLQACVFTKDEGSGLVFAKELHVGTVQINGSPQRGPDHFPFLGIKRSGVGVQGVRYSLEAMSRLRPIVINKPS